MKVSDDSGSAAALGRGLSPVNLMIPMLTAEQFLEQRFELPESGQWAELAEGVPVYFQPPDLNHGNTVLNLSKALARYVQSGHRGYACFDLGLLLASRPDTVRFPAVSYFLRGERFSEADRQITDTVPDLVIEIVSTEDRRRQSADRVAQYFAWGVPAAWMIDPADRSITAVSTGSLPQRFTTGQVFSDSRHLEGFELPVVELFAEPTWWR